MNTGNEGIWEVSKLLLYFNYKLFFLKKIILINKKSTIVKSCEETWVIVRELGKDDKNHFYNTIPYLDLLYIVKRDNNEWENSD